MLIQKMLGKNRVEDYSFVNYKTDKGNTISLMLFSGHGNYYDIINHNDVYFTQIIDRELLIKYIQTDKKWLTKSQAIKFAKPYYDEFKNDLINEYDEKELTT